MQYITIDDFLKLANREDFDNLFNSIPSSLSKETIPSAKELLKNIEISPDMERIINKYPNPIGMIATDNDGNLVEITKSMYDLVTEKKKLQDTQKYFNINSTKEDPILKRFTVNGFYIPEFSFLKYIPYHVLYNIDKTGKRAIGSSFMYKNEKITLSERIYDAAMEAVTYLRKNFTSVETGVQSILRSKIGALMDIYKFAGINNLKELLEKYADAYNIREQMRLEEQAKERQQDLANKAKQKQNLNTDHVLDAQREQARQRQMQEMNNYDSQNRQNRQQESFSETPFQKEPAYAQMNLYDKVLKFAKDLIDNE